MGKAVELLEAEIARQEQLIQDLRETNNKYLARARKAEANLKTLVDTLLQDDEEIEP